MRASCWHSTNYVRCETAPDPEIAWHHVVRRVLLGDGTREDHELTDLLA